MEFYGISKATLYFCLIVCFDHPGKKSFRDTNEGSWFIQTFCDNLKKYAEYCNLDYIMRLSASDVAKIWYVDANNKVIHQVVDRIYDSGSKNIYLCQQGKEHFYIIHVTIYT